MAFRMEKRKFVSGIWLCPPSWCSAPSAGFRAPCHHFSARTSASGSHVPSVGTMHLEHGHKVGARQWLTFGAEPSNYIVHLSSKKCDNAQVMFCHVSVAKAGDLCGLWGLHFTIIWFLSRARPAIERWEGGRVSEGHRNLGAQASHRWFMIFLGARSRIM